jgi:transposase-like protein
MAKKRPRRSPEFTFQVALKEFKEQKTLSQLDSEHQVYPTQFTHWKKQLLDSGSTLFSQQWSVAIRFGVPISPMCRCGWA